MSSYWVASDKVPVEQKSVRIPSENGTNFIAGQEIRIRIDPSLKFFNPASTYLEASVKITPPTYKATPSGSSTLPSPTRLQLDAETGFQSLCRSVRIHDNNGVLLEEIDNYNSMVAVKYDYHTNQSLRNKRALTEGSTVYDSASRGDQGGTKTHANNCLNNPYSRLPVQTVAGESNASLSASDFVTAKVCMPLHTGIMSNSAIFPNMLLGGITITILLEDSRNAFRQLDTVMEKRRLVCNPQFRGTTIAGASVPTNGSFNQIILQQNNSQHTDVSQCPFVVGEKLGAVEYGAGAGKDELREIVFKNASGVPEISSITKSGDYLVVTLNASVEITGAGMGTFADTAPQTIFFYSRSVADATNYDCSYAVSDVNLIVQEVNAGAQYESAMMKKMKEGGKIQYDFLSTTTYKYSQLASDRVANIRLPLNNMRCKSILCVPTDATIYTQQQVINASDTYKIRTENFANPDYYLRSNRPNLVGISDHVTDYQWLYDGKLQPSRRVPLNKTSSTTSIDAQALIELDKSLSMAGITGHSMAKFNENFVIGRALALGDGVYDARGKDFSLQINYNEATAPTRNKLWLSFVYHIRRIELDGNSVQVIV